MVIDFLKIIGVGFLTLISYLILKPLKPDIAIIIGVIGGIIIFFMSVDGISQIITTIAKFIEKTNINIGLFNCILKIIGVGYITEFATNVCSNSGNSSIGDMVSFAGKITILVLSLPIVTNLLELIIGILP